MANRFDETAKKNAYLETNINSQRMILYTPAVCTNGNSPACPLLVWPGSQQAEDHY